MSLLRLRVSLQSIVMSASVCLSVCLSAKIYPEPHARSLPIFVHVADGRGSVLLRRGDKIPRGRGNFGVFFPIDNALYCVAVGTHIKTVERIEMRFGLVTRAGHRYHALDGGPISQGEGAIFDVRPYRSCSWTCGSLQVGVGTQARRAGSHIPPTHAVGDWTRCLCRAYV